MRGSIQRARVALCLIFSMSILLSASGEAFAASEVRLLHAVPGGPPAQLQIGGGDGPAVELEKVGFGKASEYDNAPSGEAVLTLVSGGKQLGRSSETLEDGARYTVVAVPGGEGATLRLYADGQPAPGRTRWRMVHAAPELDQAEFMLDDRVVSRLSLSEASDYSTVEPGVYGIGARRPGETEPLVERPDVSLVAGTAQTAYLVGSGGERTRFTILEDAATAPPVAPDTGLGGLGERSSPDGPPWAAALLTAALAGMLGGAAFTRARAAAGRRRG